MQVDVSPLTEINFAPANELEEIIQNVRCILATQKGTVPLDRAFGLDADIIDTPQPQAQLLYQVAIIDAIETYEPRARVVSVNFKQSNSEAADGILIPIVKLEITTGENDA